MAFQIKDRATKSKFAKVEYMQFTPGIHTLRILQPTEDAFYAVTHFLVTPTGRMTVACLDDECPVCQNNRRIYLENPKNAYTVPGFFGKSDRYTLNVLDRTRAKICPQCGAEVKKVGPSFPAMCPSCNTMVAQVVDAPVNKVKLLQLSKTAAQQLNDVESTQIDPITGDPISITTYDMVFSVSMSAGKKTVTPIPSPSNNDVVTVPEDQLLNTDCTMKLTASEIIDVLKGVSLKDIFAARKATTSVEPARTAPEAESDAEATLKAKISQLYGE